MARPFPDLTDARYASLRQQVDAWFLTRARILEDRYYGTATAWDADGNATARAADGWRDGGTNTLTIGGKTFAGGPDPLARFNRIHGALWKLHRVAIMMLNILDGSPHGDLHLAKYTDENGQLVVEDLRPALKQWVLAFEAEYGVDVSDIIPDKVRTAVVNYLRS